MAIDSTITQIGLTVLNAVVHYILYRTAVTLILLAKDKFVEIFGTMVIEHSNQTPTTNRCSRETIATVAVGTEPVLSPSA